MEREEDNKEEITLSSSLTSSIPKRSVMSLPSAGSPPRGGEWDETERSVYNKGGGNCHVPGFPFVVMSA